MLKMLDLSWLTIGLMVLIGVLFPYWLFGNFSALGWYDEFNAVIPWYFAKTLLYHNTDGFMHSYSGGAGGAFICVSGNEQISLYKLLISYLNLWVAGFLMRLMGLFFLFSGVYVFIRQVICHPSAYFAFSASMFCVLVDYIPYGWTLGGLGWDLSIIAWLNIILFSPFKKNYHQYFFALIVSIIASITCMPIFLIPFSLYMFMFCLFLLPNTSPKAETWLRWIIIWAIFFLLMTLNWFDALKHALIDTKDFSARIQGILSDRNVISNDHSWFYNAIQLINYNGYIYYLYLMRLPHPLLIAAYGLIAVVMIYKQLVKKIFIFLSFTFFIPIIFDLFFKLSNISYLSKYEWNNLWELQPMLISFYITYLLSDTKFNHQHRTN